MSTTKLVEALRDAATSLETIALSAGYKYDSAGQENYLRHFDQVRGYAHSRATVARAALEAQAEAKPAEPASGLSPLARRRVFDAIRAAYDMGHSDRQNNSYAGREVEVDHGGALISGLESIAYLQAAPAAPAPADTKDAERYRWLRERGDGGCTEKDGYGGQTLRMGKRLDAAIDAAIAASKGEQA